MNDKPEAVEQFRLDTLTKSTRFIASIGPRCATRISLGVCLGVEDTATDPAGELLGIKLHQGASALASCIGSIASSVREGVRSKGTQLGSDPGVLPAVPAIEKAKDFVMQGVAEVRDSWASAGYIAVQVEQPQAQESDEPAALLAGQLSPSSDSTEEVNDR